MDTFRAIFAILLLPACFGVLAWLFVKLWKYLDSLEKEFDHDERIEDGRCGECGYDLRSGHKVCPECGAKVLTEQDRATACGAQLNQHALASNWPQCAAQLRVPSAQEVPTPVLSTIYQPEAELLVQQLSFRGIAASLERSADFRIGGTLQSINDLLVVVPSGDRARAESIIDQFRWDEEAIQSAPHRAGGHSDSELNSIQT